MLGKREIKDDRRIDRYRRMIIGDERADSEREEGCKGNGLFRPSSFVGTQ
jgi:hypothetical protein